MAFTRRMLAALAAPALIGPALAQDFPSNTIRIVVPFAPGGSLDILGRLYAQRMSERLGWRVVVENRSGAGGLIGTELVAHARPDGLTILLNAENITVLPGLFPNLSFDPLQDLQALVLAARITHVLCVPASSPIRSFAQYVETAKARPGEMAAGNPGAASTGHLCTALLNQQGVPVTPVAFRGGGESSQALLAGQIPSCFLTIPVALQLVRNGSIRPLAVTSPRRSLFLPDVESFADTFPSVGIDSWQGFFLPSGTPAPIAERLHREMNETTRMESVRQWLLDQAFEPVIAPSAELAGIMAREVPRWRHLAQTVDLQGI